MPRLPVINRKPASEKAPLYVARKMIPSPPNDKKLRVVLDTGILVAGLIAKQKEFLNSAPYQIIEAFKNNSYYMMITAILLSEYERVLHHQACENRICSSDIGTLMNLVRAKGYFGRMYVEKPVATHKGNDDLLLMGLVY